MDGQFDRRSMLALAATGAVSAALTACGSRTKLDIKAATATPVAPQGSFGRLSKTLMIIRHAEKPTGTGAPYGVTQAGVRDAGSLTVRGLTRAGALVDLLNPRGSDGTPAPLRRGILRPAVVFAAKPDSDGGSRPQETVTPLAAALNLQVDTRFAQGQEADLVAALQDAPGPFLVSWKCERIGAIITNLGHVDPTPPESWPADCFDMLYVFSRNGSGWAFTQVPQMLLAGDSPTPIT
jgi:hypothetical protein